MLEFFVFIINIFILSIILKGKKCNICYSLLLSFLITWVVFINVNPYNIKYNKYLILKHIPDQYKPESNTYNGNINLNTLKYPIVFKPNVCSRISKNVVVIDNVNEAIKYISNNDNDIVIQEFVNYDVELAVLCEKNIITDKFEIISIVQKKEKNGNNKIMSGCHGNVKCTILNNIINDKLNSLFDYISKCIPNFNVGRYDIKCKDINSFINGKFYILEVNGTMGFDLSKQIDIKEFGTYKNVPNAFIIVQRWYIKRFIIGMFNIINSKGYNIKDMLSIMYTTLYNYYKCKDWEKLFTLYS